MKQSHF